MLDELLSGQGNGTILDVLPELEQTLAQTSICGLGQVALNPIVSALEYWGEELTSRLGRRNG
jgi:NADH:ubiquinone oxidoreductase subunit F (NADH-binding)